MQARMQPIHLHGVPAAVSSSQRRCGTPAVPRSEQRIVSCRISNEQLSTQLPGPSSPSCLTCSQPLHETGESSFCGQPNTDSRGDHHVRAAVQQQPRPSTHCQRRRSPLRDTHCHCRLALYPVPRWRQRRISAWLVGGLLVCWLAVPVCRSWVQTPVRNGVRTHWVQLR